jgi:SAM-dependent methyltransferase
LIKKAGRVIAIKPGWAMLQQAAVLGKKAHPVCALAEAVPLITQSLDLISVAQAIHWFEPHAARREMQRVLRPEGWLVLLKNNSLTQNHTENGVVFPASSTPPPIESYFQPGTQQSWHFTMKYQQDWEAFWGALNSASFTPLPDHPRYPTFKQAAFDVFCRYAQNGLIDQEAETELIIGKLIRE